MFPLAQAHEEGYFGIAAHRCDLHSTYFASARLCPAGVSSLSHSSSCVSAGQLQPLRSKFGWRISVTLTVLQEEEALTFKLNLKQEEMQMTSVHLGSVKDLICACLLA